VQAFDGGRMFYTALSDGKGGTDVNTLSVVVKTRAVTAPGEVSEGSTSSLP
jgi:hypothetical protein